MEDFFNWISTNKAWLFEGLGVVIILGIIRYFWKNNKANQNETTVSNTATGNGNNQAGRDINIIQKEEKKKLKKREVSANLYEKLSKLNDAMREITVLFRDITGKEPETVEKEELDRLKTATDLGNDFLNFYNQNKIFFDEESCKLIEEIGAKFKSSHAILYSLKRMNLEPSSLTNERTNEAIRLVREEAPPLKVQLEGRLRAVLED